MSPFVPLMLSVVVLLAPQAAGAAAKTIEKVDAVVNDEIILDSELEQWALPTLRQAIDLDTPAGRKEWDDHKHKVLDQLIDGKLIGQQATELKLSVAPDEIDRAIDEVKRQNKLDDTQFVEALKQQGFTLESYRKNLRRQILELKVINTAVRSRVSVTDDEIKSFYQQNTRQLGGEKTVHLRQILVTVPEGAPPAEIERRRQVATKALELARGGKPFADLAKTYSDDEATKSGGGDLGWIGPGVLAEPVQEVVDSMETNDLRGPIRTPRGFAILQLVERKVADVRGYDEVKESLRKQLYDQQVEKATQQWTRELRKKAHVDIRF